MRGLSHIQETFSRAKTEGRAAFMPFFTVGYPDYLTSLEALCALAEAGADALEVGMPFSDPLADGPVIQHASQIALNNGIKIKDCVRAIKELRARGVTIPLILMGYLNPLLNYGLGRLVEDAAGAGADGFIIPDLPPEEALELHEHTVRAGMGQIPLIAPNTHPDRVKQVAKTARGFVYLVSVTGVTGARESLPTDLRDYIQRARSQTDLPLAVGFGISTPEQAHLVATHADGVIVASALIRLMEQKGLGAVKALAGAISAACKR